MQESVAYFDMTGLGSLDLSDASQRRRYWDETHLIASLQGLVNRDAPRLYIRYNLPPDDFWWERMTEPGGWLAGHPVERMDSLEQLLQRFSGYYAGVVVWDERVPATSNLASSIAGADGLLCLRYDGAAGSLYQTLVEGGPRLPVKVRLLAADGFPMFTGAGTIPGTQMPSTGSAKCDAYLWLTEHYLKTGKLDPRWMGYYIDGFWLDCRQAGGRALHTVTNHDWVIARRGLMFDLGMWDDETPVDDRGQEPGTDATTLRALLRAAYDSQGGEGVTHVAGFVPWAYKYTSYKTEAWDAGGKHEPVPAEWKYAEILSCFNAYMDADAIGYCPMANASFFQHYPLQARYGQPHPSKEKLQEAGILTADGHIAPGLYYAHYVGDYDAAAWLYWSLPTVWTDAARGTIPLSWAFNPNLAERFPLGMAWTRETATGNDFFVAGDSGAGYLNPGLLAPPRLHSQLPSGVAAWERHCARYYEQWDLRVTGFVIDGFGQPMSDEVMDSYARFSPGGMVAQKVPPQGLQGAMPYLRMGMDLPHDEREAAQAIWSRFRGPGVRFAVCRSILKPPSWYAAVDRQLGELGGPDVRIVDLETLLWLVGEFETHRSDYVQGSAEYANATEVLCTPQVSRGLATVGVDDGPVVVVEEGGVPAWRIAAHTPPRYLYFAADDAFAPQGGGLTVEVEYLDRGMGEFGLQYDSSDRNAPHWGAYRAAEGHAAREDSGRWRTQRFVLPDARLRNSQNGGADLRLFSPGDDLLVRAVRLTRR